MASPDTSTATVSATTAANTVSVASGATALVNVKFTAAASAAQMAVADKANGAQHVRDLSQIRTHTLRVPQAALSGVLTALHHSLGVERVNAAVQLGAAGSPNDPDYPQQWALPQIGWDQAYGSVAISGSATIAVLDTGVDASHSDLAGRVVAGQSEVGGDPNADPNGHGTALAGIAAATTNNGTGMAGVAWAGTSVSSVQVLGADGTGYDSDVVAGVLWAADHGASVLLMGFSSATYSATLADALDYAWGKGVVLVAATGNDGSSTTSYPAGMPHVLGVAATDAQDHVATFSNTGSAAVAAPGVNVLTTQPGGGYGAVSGTSAASAHVAGLAALLVASGHSASLTHDQIVGTTDPVSGTATFGRLDVARALGAPVTPLPTATAGASPTPDGSPTYIAAATSTNLTTVEVTNLSPDSAPPGATKVAVLSFTVHTGSLGTEKFQQVKPTFTGSATTADVQTVYLYQEAGAVAGSSFDPATDTFRASASPVACGTQLTLNPADFTLPPNSDVKFYLVVDLKTTATLGRTVDFRVNANAATFQSGTWPPTAESTTSTSCTVAANTWNPAGVTTIANPTPTPTATATATSTPTATATATAIASPTATGTPRVCQPVTTPDAWGRPWTSTCYGVLR